MKSRLKRLVAILLVNLILIGLGVIVLELIFGNWIRPDNLNKLNIIRSRTISYDITDLYDHPSNTITYSRDEYGLRGSFEEPDEIDILTVGGSTTDQRYISDGQTWQDVIQYRFRSIGKNVVVANAGVDGQSTYGHIKNFDWWFPCIPNLKPKYILFYVGLNDFYNEGGSRYDALVRNEKSFRQVLREKSAIYHAFRTLEGIYKARIVHEVGHIGSIDFSEMEWTTTPLQKDYDMLMDKQLSEYAERLTILIARTREFGSEPIFVTQPSRRYRFNEGSLKGTKTPLQYGGVLINGVDYYHMMRRLDSVTCSTSLEHNVMCIDMAKDNLWEDEDFYDFWHMTPTGAKKAGDYLFEGLKEKF